MMSKRTDDAKKTKLLKRVRHQRLKYITILPSLITLLNGICGFAAIVFASKGVEQMSVRQIEMPYFAWSGYMIFFAMIADMLDGRVARMSKTTSSFGGQLDSLCDMISFGVAPAFLMLKVVEHKLGGLIGPEFVLEGFVYRFVWLAAASYMACAAIRLARFNVENEEDETAHMSFVGLPTPAAAGVPASLIVFYEDMLLTAGADSILFKVAEGVIIYSLPFVAIGVAILMIGRIRYPHMVNLYLRGRKPIKHLQWAVVIFAMIVFFLQTALVLSFCGFALTGFGKWLLYRIRALRKSERNAEPPVLTVTTPADADDQTQ